MLADTLGNLVTRVLRFAAKNWDGRLPPLLPEHAEELDRVLLTECGPIADPAVAVQAYRFRRAAEELLGNATAANVFVDRLAPWTLRKTDAARAGSVVNTAAEWLGWLARWMAPFLPARAQQLWAMLGQPGRADALPWPSLPRAGAWRSLDLTRPLGEVAPLFAKLDDEVVAAEIKALQQRTLA